MTPLLSVLWFIAGTVCGPIAGTILKRLLVRQ